MPRIPAVLSACVATVAAVLVAPTSVSADDGLAYQAPIKLVVDQPTEQVPWAIVGTDIDWVKQNTAELDKVSPFQQADYQYFYGQTSGTFTFDATLPMGRYYVNGLAFDADAEETREPTPAYFYARYAGRSTLTGSRSGDKVTLRATTTRYSGSGTTWVPNAGATVNLQRHTASGWVTVSTSTVPSGGTNAWTLTATSATYRVSVATSATVWGGVSANKTL